MLIVTKQAPDRLDVELDGLLDAELMRIGLDDLIAKSEGIKHGRMLYRITHMEMPTGGALGVEFTRLPQLFSLIGRFERCAVLADEGWLRMAAEIEGMLIPGLTIKAFPLDEAEAAEAWLSA